MGRFLLAACLMWLPVAAFAQSASLPPGTTADTPAPAATQPQDPLSDAEAKLVAKDDAGAAALLRVYISAHPADARALFDLGYAEDAEGHTEAAEADYRKAVAAAPQQFESRAALGLLLANEGKNAEAVLQLSAAARLSPVPPNQEAQAQANRALARLLEPTEPAAASRALVAALAESHETDADTLLAAEIAARQGNVDGAADAYGRVLHSAPAGSPERGEATAGLAHLLIAAKRYSDAEAVLRKALAENSGDPAFNVELAEVLSAEGKTSGAIALLENVHAAHPGDVPIASMLLDLYEQAGEADKADPLLQQLLASQPHDPGLLAERGDALVREKKFAEAIPVLQEATALAPKNGNAWSSLAFAADQTHQPDLVLKALAMRSKVMSETPATYFLAATAYDSLHQTKRAAELYRQFLAVAGSSFPDEVWQAKHRLVALAR